MLCYQEKLFLTPLRKADIEYNNMSTLNAFSHPFITVNRNYRINLVDAFVVCLVFDVIGCLSVFVELRICCVVMSVCLLF